MSDLTFTIGADDSAFRSTLRNMEKDASASAEKVAKSVRRVSFTVGTGASPVVKQTADAQAAADRTAQREAIKQEDRRRAAEAKAASDAMNRQRAERAAAAVSAKQVAAGGGTPIGAVVKQEEIELAKRERAVEKSGRRVGQMFSGQTRDLRGIVTGIRSPFVIAAGAAATVALVGRTYETIAGAGDRAALAAMRQRQEIDALAVSLRGVRESYKAIERSASGAGADPLAELRTALLSSQALQNQIRDQIVQQQTIVNANTGVRGRIQDITDFRPDGLTSPERRANAMTMIVELQAKLNALVKEDQQIGELRAKVIDRTFRQMWESSRLDFVRAQNNPNATAEAEEDANHRERVKRIMELMSLDRERAQRLLALENQRNALEKQKIATQIRRQSEDAEFQIRQQEIESQKLSEQVEILNKRRNPNRPGPSEDMQRQLDRDRAIEEFRRRTDLTEQQRQRLIDNENLNYFLRSQAAQAARPPMFEKNAPVSQGFLGAGSVANRILPQAMDPLTAISSGVARVVHLVGQVDRALREGGTVALEIE